GYGAGDLGGGWSLGLGNDACGSRADAVKHRPGILFRTAAAKAMSDNRLLGLVLVFAPLSALSFGGGQAIIADMQHQTVAQGWLSDTEFADLFAISRAAPGPSTLISALIGWQVAGLVGAVV